MLQTQLNMRLNQGNAPPVLNLIPQTRHARGMPVRPGDVVQSQETVRVPALKLKVFTHPGVVVVTVDEDEIYSAKVATKAFEVRGCGIAQEESGLGGDGQWQAQRLRIAIVAGGNEIKSEQTVQG